MHNGTLLLNETTRGFQMKMAAELETRRAPTLPYSGDRCLNKGSDGTRQAAGRGGN
jgi:hypothetical protein